MFLSISGKVATVVFIIFLPLVLIEQYSGNPFGGLKKFSNRNVYR